MVVNVAGPDGRVRPLHWVEDLDWKAYAIVWRLHAIDHLKQLKKVLAAARDGLSRGRAQSRIQSSAWRDRRPGAAVEADQRRHLGPPVQALPLDALAVALEDPAAHVGVERLALHAQERGRLLDRQVLLAVQVTIRPRLSEARRPPARARPAVFS